MTLQDLGSIGELVGALATVVMLAYLAVQIRQNTRQLSLNAKSMEAASGDAWMQYGVTFRGNFIHDPAVARLFREGLSESSPLSEDDQFRFHFIMLDAFTTFQTAVTRRRAGFMDDDTWHFQGATLAVFLAAPGFYTWWPLGRRILGPSCVEFVESRPEFRGQQTSA